MCGINDKHITIVGGVYEEICQVPQRDCLFGSGGKAAVALGTAGCRVTLYTTLSSKEERSFNISWGRFVSLQNVVPRNKILLFNYFHSLSTPYLSNARLRVEQFHRISDKVILKFGMIEADPPISAEYGIYDPQSTISPKALSSSGSKVEHLAIVANEREILALAQKNDLSDSIEFLFESERAEIIVVKQGFAGASVYQADSLSPSKVPAYKSNHFYKIGSGDIFSAFFAYEWGVLHKAPHDAADIASRRVSEYVERPYFPLNGDINQRQPILFKRKNVYLAGTFRKIEQYQLICDAKFQLEQMGMDVFSPIHDVGNKLSPAEIASRDLCEIKTADTIFAIFDANSPGTNFELGYAAALNKPIICFAQNYRDDDVIFLRGIKARIYDDFPTALSQVVI